jgi:hypothetical protein
MATYREIQNWLRTRHNFVPKTCWIAHVMSEHGLTRRPVPNRLDQASRKYPCPDDKRPAILEALRKFSMV